MTVIKKIKKIRIFQPIDIEQHFLGGSSSLHWNAVEVLISFLGLNFIQWDDGFWSVGLWIGCFDGLKPVKRAEESFSVGGGKFYEI